MKSYNKIHRILMLLVAFMVAIGCGSDDGFEDIDLQSSQKVITSFAFNDLTPPVNGTINNNELTVIATVPFDTDVTNLVPTIQISQGASIAPPSGIAIDFTNPVTLVVTAEDGSTANWTVTISKAEPEAQARLVLSDPIWERSPSGTGVPSFMADNGERGIAFGNNHLYITHNNDKILILNPDSGTEEGELNMEGIDGGEPKISDVATSADGSILACNAVEWTSDAGGQPTEFKVYRWADENAEPEVFLTYTNTQFRMGDSFSVIGDVSSEAVIMTVFGRKFLNPTDRGNIVLKWRVSGGVVASEPEIIEVGGVPSLTRFGSRPHAQMLSVSSQELYVNANDIEITKAALDGTFINRLPNTNRQLYDGFSSYFEIFEFAGKTVIATAFPRSSIESRLIVIDISNGIENATPEDVILSKNFMQGSSEIANVNANGAIAVNKLSENNVEVYCMITNQALVKFNLSTVLE